MSHLSHFNHKIGKNETRARHGQNLSILPKFVIINPDRDTSFWKLSKSLILFSNSQFQTETHRQLVKVLSGSPAEPVNEIGSDIFKYIPPIFRIMKIIKDPEKNPSDFNGVSKIEIAELKKMSEKMFDNLVKAVVDIEKEIMAVDGGLHSDELELLIENGSNPENLWGINIYPELEGEKFIEFDSMVNIRPAVANRTRGIDNSEIREKIIKIVNKLVVK